jgi:hypothetical protein
MKKYNVRVILFTAALCVLLSFFPIKGYAETMTLTLESVGGQSSGPDYVYPYDFSFDGSTTLTPLMCISYENEIYFGESWTATLMPISGNALFVEAAYIFSLAAAPGASATTIAEAQWANWELFDPGDTNLLNNVPAGYQGDINTMLDTASNFAQNNVNTTLYSNLNIFAPTLGSQTEGGLPQYFIGDPQPSSDTPEPSSFILFGSGLFGLAALWLRRKCVV